MDFSFHLITAVLAVCHGARSCICTRSIRHEHVAIQAVALVAAVRIHAPMLAWPRLHPTLVKILIACFARVAWIALASVWSHTLSVFTSMLAHRLALTPGSAVPSPAAVRPKAIAAHARKRTLLADSVAAALLSCGAQIHSGHGQQMSHETLHGLPLPNSSLGKIKTSPTAAVN